MSVSVPDDLAVGGLLQPGQRVDLVVTMAINPELGPTPDPSATPTEAVIPGPSTKVTLQTLTILARNGAMYILRADLATAEQIAELQASGGQFALVLRPRGGRPHRHDPRVDDRHAARRVRFPDPQAAELRRGQSNPDTRPMSAA